MATKLTAAAIQALGFQWPKHPIINDHLVSDAGQIDLSATLSGLRASQAYYRSQLNAAFNFKQQTGADYTDFSDRYEDEARTYHALKAAIAHLEQILEAAGHA